MRCPYCQHQNREGARFCAACGRSFASKCPTCGSEPPPGAAFCDHCGTPLTGMSTAAAPPPLAPRPQRPQAYTPTHLAEKILTSKTALEGERKQVTVLFADLKGSMELLADRDPEEARQLLDPVLTLMMDAVHRYEGTVNQVMGDGIMALFGAPIAHEDHAVRACYAALAMQASVKQYAAEVQRTRGVPIQMRVGLNSGEVVVRAIGSDLHMDYTAVGQTTHLAARMEQMAIPGSILITAGVLSLAEGYIQVHPLGPAPVKGLTEPVEVFEVAGAGPVRTRLQAAARRGLTQFVGREPEMEALCQALERAGTRHGQVVAIVGEPGVGKSRLVYEFTRSHRTQGWVILEGSSVSYGRAKAYLPVIDLLKTYCAIEARDDTRRVREKVMGKVLGLDEALRPMLPAILELLDVLEPDPQWQALEPPQRRQRTLEAVKRLLVRESQVQPVLVVFEDLHWIDAETQAFLDSMVESLPTARLLLLVNYRPEYQHGWGSKTYYSQLRLDVLPPMSAAALMQALLGEDASLAPLGHLLIARTEGNPFFLEECVRSLAETGILSGEPGAYRLAQAQPTLQIPATVQAILAARIDRLPPDERYLLQTAAVIGTEIAFTLLQVIAELPEAALERGLARLQAAEFLYEASLFPDLAYTFKHALTHEVAYGSLLQERRRGLHARIVEAIEALSADRVAEQVEWLAHHALRGEMWEKAVTYCHQAGAKAAARSANREAVARFEQALGALQHLPDSRHTHELAIDLRFDLRHSLDPMGALEQVRDRLREAKALAERLGDPRRLGKALSYLTDYSRVVSDYDRAAALGQRALAIADGLGEVSLRDETQYRLGQVYYALGDYRRAINEFERAVVALEGHRSSTRGGQPGLPSVFPRSWLVWCCAELGEFAAGIATGKEAIRTAEVTNYPHGLIAAQHGVGRLYLRKGDLPQALLALEQGLERSRVGSILSRFHQIASDLGVAYALFGRVTEALPLLEQAVQRGGAVRAVYRALWAAGLSEAYRLAGRLEEASQLGQHALELSRKHKERGHEAWALRVLGEIASHDEPLQVELAEGYFHQALALADELGMRPLQAHCHLGLGTLYAKIGQREPARAELSAAIALYREMEMTFWLPQAEAALAQVVETRPQRRRKKRL